MFKDKQSKKWLLGAKKENDISISDFVAVSFDERNCSNWMSACLIGIVFNIGKGGSYGVNVVSKHGILAKNLHTKFPEISVTPMEKYEKLILTFPVCKQLSDIRAEVMNGTCDKSKHQWISSKQAYHFAMGQGGKCSCKNERCNVNCGCRKLGVLCTIFCACG